MPAKFNPEIIGILLLSLSNRRLEFPYWRFFDAYDLDFFPPDEIGNLSEYFQHLSDWGLIQSVEKQDKSVSPLAQWRLSTEEEFQKHNGNNHDGNDSPGDNGPGDNGGGPGGGGGGLGGNNNDGNGGGIREVLSHPNLFSLPTTELNAIIDGLFEDLGAE